MKVNIFKEENLFWTIFKKLIGSFVLALALTFGVSLLVGYQYKIVASGSMTPYLPIHSIVMIQPVEYEELKVGDIVTYRSSNTTGIVYTFTHRVVRIADNGNIITGGDANIQADGTIKEDGEIVESRVLGKVVAHSYPLGALVTYVKQNIFQCALVLIIIFLTSVIVS